MPKHTRKTPVEADQPARQVGIKELRKGDKVVSPKYRGEILTVLEDPHPMLIDSGLDCKMRRANGLEVFFRDYTRAPKQTFIKVSGFEEMPLEDMQIFIREEVGKFAGGITNRLLGARRIGSDDALTMIDIAEIFAGEINNLIK